MPIDTVALSTIVAAVVLLLLFLYLSVRLVQQYERMVILRLGRAGPDLVREPGLRFVIPVIDRAIMVDIRERLIEIDGQTAITKDKAPITIDFLIYWHIVDPWRSVVSGQDFAGALREAAEITVRAVVGDAMLDDVLSEHQQISAVLRAQLDKEAQRWGGKVATVEIRDIGSGRPDRLIVDPPGTETRSQSSPTGETLVVEPADGSGSGRLIGRP